MNFNKRKSEASVFNLMAQLKPSEILKAGKLIMRIKKLKELSKIKEILKGLL